MKHLINLLNLVADYYDRGVRKLAKFIKAKTEIKKSEVELVEAMHLATPVVLFLLNICFMEVFGAVAIFLACFAMGYAIGKSICDTFEAIAPTFGISIVTAGDAAA